MSKGRIGIIYPWPNLDSVPGVCNAAVELARSGYVVDVYTHLSADYRVPIFEQEEITLLPLPLAIDTVSAAGRLVVRSWLRRLGPVYSGLRVAYQGLKRWLGVASSELALRQVRARNRQMRYRCLIGVDAEGLVLAHRLAEPTGIPLVYYSLELLLAKEVSAPEQARLKADEIAISAQAEFIIIQDRHRAELLAVDNGLPASRFVLVPNAPLGPAGLCPNRYWHKRFSLPDEARVVLHAGSIATWTGIDDIVADVESWPNNWILVVHTRAVASDSEEIVRLQVQAPPKRVLFSLEPVSRQEYEELVAGADIGIAFYVPTPGSTYTGENLQTIGLSSGKIAYYLRAGLPVIVNTATSIGQLIRSKGCGVAVAEGKNVGAAIKGIEQDYVSFSRRALEAFDQDMDFARHFQEVIKRFDARPKQVHGK